MKDDRWTNRILGCSAIFCVLAALALSVVGGRLDGMYRQEWVRALLQAGIVSAFGFAATRVLERFKDDLQQRRDDRKLRLEILHELSQAYMEVKLVRRKVQTNGSLVAMQAEELNDIQSRIEITKRVSAHYFHHSLELQGFLGTMESYLNNLANDPSSMERSEFGSKGFRLFAHAFENASTLIRGELFRRQP